MKHFWVLLFSFISGLSLTAQDENVIKDASLEKGDSQWVISFEVKAPTDVEISIADKDGKILRHLAAGKIGLENTVEPFQKNSLQQKITWDGLDDNKNKISKEDVQVQIRCGLHLKLDQIIGGDPYAFFTEQLGIGDHAGWAINGLEAKSDGKVYVIANLNTYGAGVIRCYEADGTYHHLVYPPAANHKTEEVKDWGLVEKADKTYSFLYNDLGSPALGTFPLTGHRAKLARLIPSFETNRLSLYDRRNDAIYFINTNGTHPVNTKESIVTDPPLAAESKMDQTMRGDYFICHSADKKSYFLSGFYCTSNKKTASQNNLVVDGFWRDGRIYQIDATTKKATIFHEIEPITDDKERFEIISDSRTTPYAAFHGIATDKDGNLFICDRQNKQILILDAQGKKIKTIPLAYADAIAISPKTNKLYVTTRVGVYYNRILNENPKYELKLYTFNDWRKDETPTFQKRLSSAGMFHGSSYLAIASKEGKEYLWVAYNYLPVQIYVDNGDSLSLHADFNQKAKLHSMDFQYLAIDTQKEHLYIGDGFSKTFRIKPLEGGKVENLIDDQGQQISSVDIIVDSKFRKIYTRAHHNNKLTGYTIQDDGIFKKIKSKDKEFFFTEDLSNDWRIFLGFATRGGAVTNQGDLVTLGALAKNDYSGALVFWKSKQEQEDPWPKTVFSSLGDKPSTGGVQTDLQGNIYVGINKRRKADSVDPAFSKNSFYLNQNGVILKFKPTGTTSDSYYPTAPDAHVKEYNVPYGTFANNFTRTPRFAVDAYGRLYIPDALYPKVRVIDNEGESLYEFGTYGNQDSKGGLANDLVPTKDVPMAWPNAVVVSDNHVYVGDIVNCRLLCLSKKYHSQKNLK